MGRQFIGNECADFVLIDVLRDKGRAGRSFATCSGYGESKKLGTSFLPWRSQKLILVGIGVAQ